MKHKNLSDCNVHNVVIQNGTSLALLCEQNIKISKDTCITHMLQLIMFRDKQITLRLTANAFNKVLKEWIVTQHKSRRMSLRRGKQGLIMCWSFSFYKTEIK